jgi:tRNA G10  N-methylase Trm11
MYNLAHNNYHLKPKDSNIQTPPEVSRFIFELLQGEVPKEQTLIFDPCCGRGNLLSPWERAGYKSFGMDIDPIVY